ncbi:hypothetical protein FF011L_51190 [Roseimaritima multifibrata]|uniref:DUF368 domain-containing protein n=1 Tax=Roseimaritima multifibrata TaxID=1930274 RepID=A0A517MN59_9BACT|nr:DUF368 domain-containing protein [Roseimaritima multifibrata]QDS96311.1 hypothetical protein FF011L_51190 [Roseimaritima multifibrata]
MNLSTIDPVAEGSTVKASPAVSWHSDGMNVLRGYCMGAADTVPGVSGGTVALVLGHYQRLVTAISHFDPTALALLRERRWRAVGEHCDLRFLIGLAIGIAGGILSLASLMHWLLDHRMAETFAVFFGLILGSSVIVAKEIGTWNIQRGCLLIAGAAGAYQLSCLTAAGSDTSLGFIFFAGMISICAMILPGISGAFVLLLLGAYQPIMEQIKAFVAREITMPGFLQLVMFGCGCLTGLALFSRILRWLLDHRPGATFAMLLGLMLGSLRKLWPLQQATAETAAEKFSQRTWELVPPAAWEGSIAGLICLAAAAFFAVLAFEKFGQRKQAS